MIKFMISNGADANICTDKNGTALGSACMMGNKEILF